MAPPLPPPAAAERTGYRTKHYQLTRGSVGCYMSHLQLYQHIIKTDAQFAFIFEDDAVIRQPGLLAALIEAKPFPGGWGKVWAVACVLLLARRRGS
jgi:hypothetical protein